MFDLVINNGTLVDGTKVLPYKKHIGIAEGRIISLSDVPLKGKVEIDGTGCFVSPGFIDCHSHGDLIPLLEEPYRSSRLVQGITTELVGQCGISPWPFVGLHKEAWQAYTIPLLGQSVNPWIFDSLESYQKEIQGFMPNNMMALVGQGALRSAVNGLEDSPLSREQLEEMMELYEAALQQGALGVSLGLSYLPGVYGTEEELLLLGQMTKAHDGLMMAHIKSHGLEMLEAMDAYVSIAEKTGVRIHISHCRSYQNRLCGVSPEAILDRVQSYREKGLMITLDQHPYTAGSTFLNQLIPPQFRGGGSEALLQRLNNSDEVVKIKSIVEGNESVEGWDNFVQCVGWENIYPLSLTHEDLKGLNGLSLEAIGEKLSLSSMEALVTILIKEEGQGSMVVKEMFSSEDIEKLLRDSFTYIGSDGLPSGLAHPRLYGAFPHVLEHYLKSDQGLSLEELIYKMTYGPAKLLGIGDSKGCIKEGFDADIVLFNLDKIKDFEDYVASYKKPLGIEKVIISGDVVYENQEVKHDNLRGKFIKSKK